MTLITLAELHSYGRWGDFDPSIWWHWLLLLAILFSGAFLKSGNSSSSKVESEAGEEKDDRLQ